VNTKNRAFNSRNKLLFGLKWNIEDMYCIPMRLLAYQFIKFKLDSNESGKCWKYIQA